MNKVEAMCFAMFILNAAVIVIADVFTFIAYRKEEIYIDQVFENIFIGSALIWVTGLIEFLAAAIIGKG